MMTDNSNTYNNASASPAPLRRRITRACDQCNSLRTKCDGGMPCKACIDAGFECLYNRARKKRGKASTKDQQRRRSTLQQNDTRQAQQAEDGYAADGGATGDPNATSSQDMRDTRNSGSSSRISLPPMFSVDIEDDLTARQQVDGRRSDSVNGSAQYGDHSAVPSYSLMSTTPTAYGQLHPVLDTHNFGSMGNYAATPNVGIQNSRVMSAQYGLDQSRRQHPQGGENFNLSNDNQAPAGETQVPGWLGAIPGAQSPGRFSIPSMASPDAAIFAAQSSKASSLNNDLRYPVLNPVLPHIANIIPVSLACELLELYFTSSTAAFLHPTSPYVLGFVFRKRSFLHQTKPRICSPALLASMLWIAAQTSDASFLTASVNRRGKVCQSLLELTISLLKPLIHQPNSAEDSYNAIVNGVALGGFGVNLNLPLPSTGLAQYTKKSSAEVDDLMTYVHLATVISASEYKAASIRWWSVVWSLARELRFSRELPRAENKSLDQDWQDDIRMESSLTLTEESREERRRVWWLVYTVDRHLSLCYNQPLSLLDAECMTLLRPVPDEHFQNGDYYLGPPAPDSERPRGIILECNDHSIFGFLTPLMTICGEIVELQQARNHPRLGSNSRPQYEWDTMVGLIRSHLQEYADSLAAFRSRHLPENFNTTGSNLTEFQVQTIIVLAYAEHIMYVQHVLLAGKWDPIQLLEDADMWISTPEFVTASNYAIDAAEALSPILEYDPDISFMPWFYGINLLHGSFLLLLFADKLGANADERYVNACERCVRAVEACVVTLNTEYQRNFRKVMRSALAQVRGRVPSDSGEQQLKRREVLAQHRWTGDGTGLAV